MNSAVHVLLLLRADDPAHADRAWGRMSNWEPTWAPSGLDDQVNTALRLTKAGADEFELCDYDNVELKRAEQVRRERESLEDFKRRYRLS